METLFLTLHGSWLHSLTICLKTFINTKTIIIKIQSESPSTNISGLLLLLLSPLVASLPQTYIHRQTLPSQSYSNGSFHPLLLFPTNKLSWTLHLWVWMDLGTLFSRQELRQSFSRKISDQWLSTLELLRSWTECLLTRIMSVSREWWMP